MDDMLQVLNQILTELQDMNRKLDDIRGTGFCSLEDIGDKIDGMTLQLNGLDDACDKLDTISGSGLYGLDDVCNKLDSVETAIDMK